MREQIAPISSHAIALSFLSLIACGAAPRRAAPVVDLMPSSGARGSLAHQVDPAPGPVTSSVPAKLNWLGQIEPAQQLAAKSVRPLLVYIRADWAADAIRMDREVWTNPKLMRRLQSMVLLKLDFTQASATVEHLTAQLGVTGLPAVILLGPDGQERGRRGAGATVSEVLDLARNSSPR